jgi:hypothetical protein
MLSPSALLYNNATLDDFLGLTPNEMSVLLRDPFGKEAVVQLREQVADEVLDRIPLFRIAEQYLQIVAREQQLKLSPLGNLPRKFVGELYASGFLKDVAIEQGIAKVWNEVDIDTIFSARISCDLSPLLKKVKGKVSLTKLGKQLLDAKDRSAIFRHFFLSFTLQFNWSINHGCDDSMIGQFGSSFSLWLLHQFGGSPTPAYTYAQAYRKAFPILPQEGNAPPDPEQFTRCYVLRSFRRFLLWFGFVQRVHQEDPISDVRSTFIASDIADAVFVFAER